VKTARLALLAFPLFLATLPAQAGGWGYSYVNDYGTIIEAESITDIDYYDYYAGATAYVETDLYEDGSLQNWNYAYGDLEASTTVNVSANLGAHYEDYGEHYEDIDFEYLVFLEESYADVYTGDPTPSITSIDPSTWYAGSSTEVAITGTGFGTNPTVQIDASGVGWSILNAWDTEIDLEVTVDPNAPDQSDVPVTVTSNGYDGRGFVPAQQGQSNQATGNAGVVGPPALIITSNGSQVYQNATVYIDPTPHMPTIRANLVQSNGQAPSGTASFQLVIDSVTTELVTDHTDQAANQQWTAPVDFPYGFAATIHWTYNGSSRPDFQFKILGQNPDEATAFAAIDSGGWWFARNIAVHETNLAQFCEPGVTDGSDYCTHTTADKAGMPIFGPPNGYGIMQVDPPGSEGNLWDWRANVQAGLGRISSLAGPESYTNGQDGRAFPFWIRQVQQWQDYNAAHQGNEVAAYGPVSESDYCTFVFSATRSLPPGSPNTYHWFGDAILMKQYAGAPTNFISWDNTDPLAVPHWSVHEENTVNTNIVRDFCTCAARGTTCQHNR
jgi:IPT/TIG domain